MDAPCKIQGSIHVFRLVNNMCPGKWVHIKFREAFYLVRLAGIEPAHPVPETGALSPEL